MTNTTHNKTMKILSGLDSAGQPLPEEMLFLGRIGPLEVRMATTLEELYESQRLRFEIFYGEMSAVVTDEVVQTGLDADAYDEICDHLLVLDHSREVDGKPAVVGTYRLLRQEIANKYLGFYTASEFNVGPLIAANPDLNFLELGRSCVMKEYRDKRTVELLWQGIWNYVRRNKLDVMFGCASLEGVNPQDNALPLSFLHHFASSPEEWKVRALDERFVDMNMMAKEEINPKHALHELPPMVKGYLRLGASFGEGAVVDYDFGTTDVLVMLPVSAINPRYLTYFNETGEVIV
ncbi:GNAT family N-acetyltransferase [Microvirga sp. W0021]|uniref:L-ornithine N(alpha)-acyltransferase n=1 Tax=Hohaiivirga grylli TaxID=3133970 RepID=A0ABV0BJS6_9HYPH